MDSLRALRTRTRWVWELSIVVALGLATIVAATELENPWVSLIIMGVLGFLLLVPNVGGLTLAGPIQLTKSIAWWQGLWFVMLVSGLVFRGRTASDISRSPVDGWALYRISCTLLVSTVLFFRLTFRKANWLPFLFSGLIGIFSWFGIISLLSTVWSVNPLWTLYRSVEFLADVSVVAAIVATLETIEDYKRLVNWTWILLGLVVGSAWIGAAIDPADALFVNRFLGSIMPVRLVGVIPSVASNDLSQMSAILALISLCRLWTDPDAQLTKYGYRLLFVASMITLVITQTRVTYASFLIGFALLLVFERRYLVLTLGGILGSAVGALLVMFTNAGTKLQQFLLRGETTEQVNGLSGRLEVWQMSIRKILEQPWTGYGGFAGARFVVLEKSATWSDALNVYIDAMLNIGIWGLVILLVLVALVGRQLFRAIYSSYTTQAEKSLAMELSLTYAIVVIGSMESGNIITHPMLSFLTLLGFAEFLRRRNELRTKHSQIIEANAR